MSKAQEIAQVERVRPDSAPVVRIKDLPKLTDKQRAYVDARLAGLNKSDAYRKAYDCSNMQPTTLWVRACEMDKHNKVRVWLDWHRLEQAQDAVCTYNSHLQDLMVIRDEARADKQYGAAVTAERTRGQAAGLHDKTVNVASVDLNRLYEQIRADRRGSTIEIEAETCHNTEGDVTD